MPAGVIALLSLVILLILTPIILMEVMVIAFYKLGIPPIAGLVIAFGIFLGSFFNIPIKRDLVNQELQVPPNDLFGLGWRFPKIVTRQRERVIAINVGGCIIPVLIVVYELSRLIAQGVYVEVLIAVSINIYACYLLSMRVPGKGIVIPAFLPGIIAAVCGLILYPSNPSALAFCAGILGPLIGADLLRIGEIIKKDIGYMSIGGAGTFDGIVISGIVALLLS